MSEAPPLSRQEFANHLARLRQHIFRLHDQIEELGETPVELAPLVVEELEAGSALAITLLRSELKQVRTLLAEAQEEIDQHEREILVLKDQVAEERGRADHLGAKLNAETGVGPAGESPRRVKSPTAPPGVPPIRNAPLPTSEPTAQPAPALKAPAVAASADVPSPGGAPRHGGPRKDPPVIGALRELGSATAKQLAAHLNTSKMAIQVQVCRLGMRVARARPSGRHSETVYSLAAAAVPAA